MGDTSRLFTRLSQAGKRREECGHPQCRARKLEWVAPQRPAKTDLKLEI
jgi:hypothetical protein